MSGVFDRSKKDFELPVVDIFTVSKRVEIPITKWQEIYVYTKNRGNIS